MPILGNLHCYCRPRKGNRPAGAHASLPLRFHGLAADFAFAAKLVGFSIGWLVGEADTDDGSTPDTHRHVKVICPACVAAMPDFPRSEPQRPPPCHS